MRLEGPFQAVTDDHLLQRLVRLAATADNEEEIQAMLPPN